jgi:NAD-dependent dihydropyrimidine dehydrogenase PreA subunit
MCEFCTQHGEGQAWYLNRENYSQELLSQNGLRERVAEFFQNFESSVAQSLSMLDAIQALPFVPDVVGQVATARQKKSHFGQVVPIEDVDKVLGLVDSFVRLPCACRSLTTGRKEVRYCYGLGIDPTGIIGHFPDYGESLEWLTRDEAQAAIHKLDREGLVHSVWTFDTPFIAGLCNCDQDCMAYRMQVGTGMMQVFFPAEYIASVDWDRCTGCKLCRGQCPFGAIRYTATQDKCAVDPALCYGCGICRATCKRDAIRLEPRRRAFHWQRRAVTPGRHRVTTRSCQNPRECRACIDACPSRVFGLTPQRGRTPGVQAGDWVVRVLTPSRCTGCGACVAACPQGVIAVHDSPSLVIRLRRGIMDGDST